MQKRRINFTDNQEAYELDKKFKIVHVSDNYYG